MRRLYALLWTCITHSCCLLNVCIHPCELRSSTVRAAFVWHSHCLAAARASRRVTSPRLPVSEARVTKLLACHAIAAP